MPLVTLYGKPGCHLCDDARAVIVAAGEEHDLELTEVDITLEPRLHPAYAERIPVVEIDGQEVFQHFVDPAALARVLTGATKPGR